MIIKFMTSIHSGDDSNFTKQHKVVRNLGWFLLWGTAGFSYEGEKIIQEEKRKTFSY
jgi:hypothetical protein